MSNDIKQVIKEMRLQNMGYKLIAKNLGISRDTVRYYCKRLELEGTRGRVDEKKFVSCKTCGKGIEKRKHRVYCSTECKRDKPRAKPKMYTNICARCNEKFETLNKTKKYCDKDCRSITIRCCGCEKEFRSTKDSRKFCSAKCMNSSKRKSHEEYMIEFFNIHKGNIVPLELYKGSDNKLKTKCLHCSNEMNRRALTYISTYGYGCQNCNNKSRGENEIAEWLDNRKIEYQRQYSFSDLKYKQVLYYDFAVINNGEIKALIEYDGEQHHEVVEFFGGEENLKKTIERDKLKDEYAKQNNIALLRIKKKQTISKRLREFL